MSSHIDKGLRSIKGNLNNAFIALNHKFQFKKHSLPDFLIIGAQKSGTTALYSYLIQHPGIIKAKVKEVNYFGIPHNRMKGKYWYASHFCTMSEKKALANKLGYRPITGEASPNMHRPYYPGFVHELLPGVKLIAILRDPVERAFSQYQHNFRHGLENRSFEEVIADSPVHFPPEIANDEWAYYRSTYPSYITRGLYAEHLEKWYQHYDKELLHIINSSDMLTNPVSELTTVLDFLEMPHFNFQDISTRAKHSGDYKAKMSTDVRAYLTSIFRPHNKKLYELTGRDFGWPC